MDRIFREIFVCFFCIISVFFWDISALFFREIFTLFFFAKQIETKFLQKAKILTFFAANEMEDYLKLRSTVKVKLSSEILLFNIISNYTSASIKKIMIFDKNVLRKGF